MLNSRHPGLRAIVIKLREGVPVTSEEVEILARELAAPKATSVVTNRRIDHIGRCIKLARGPGSHDLISGFATEAGSKLFSAKFGKTTCSFYNTVEGIRISNLGLGTHGGGANKKTDHEYFLAVCSAVSQGVNLVDTSINYRSQRSEITIGNALRLLSKQNPDLREGLIIGTKGGYVVPGAVSARLLKLRKLSNTLHSIDPDFIDDQILRSRRNLGLKTIDIYYLHNPEVQLRYVDKSELMSRLRRVFERLEMSVSDGHIRYYGVATWSGLRQGLFEIEDLAAIACAVAGNTHRFRFVQLPINLGMPEAISHDEKSRSIVKRASYAGINVIVSAPLLQGRLSRDLPVALQHLLPKLKSDAQRALQFARSIPGVTSALVGMRKKIHVSENLELSRHQRLTAREFHSRSFFDPFWRITHFA